MHLLNEHYSIERSNTSFYFVEFHELSGSICMNETLLKVYTYQKNFDGLLVCFDMGNLTSLGSLHKLITDGLEAVEQSKTMSHCGDFAFSSGDNDLSSRLQACPTVVVGCKADSIDRKANTGGVDRLKRMTVNARVLDELKKIDEGSQIDYIEAGLSVHRGVYKVPQDDL